LVVFNQQILTGRSLQPFHYEQFIINYQILIGLVITYQLIWKSLRIRPALWVIFALVVGVATGLKSTSETLRLNRLRDEAMPVFARIEQRTQQDHSSGNSLFDDHLLAASCATRSSFGVLWSPHMYTFGSTSITEEVERFYQYLYYKGVDDKTFETMLLPVRAGSQNSFWTIFGLHRVNIKLTHDFKPISKEEIEKAVQSYSSYVQGFSREQANKWPLSYVILADGISYDLSNLDRWYERGGGERIGGSVLYPVRLRTQNED